MKKYFLILFILSNLAFSQKLTLEESVFGSRTFAPKTLLLNQWKNNEHTLTYLSDDFQNLMQRKLQNNWQEETLATKKDFENALKAKITTDEFSIRSFPFSINWLSDNAFSTEISGKNNAYYVVFNTQNKSIDNFVTYPLNNTSATLSLDQKYVASLKDNNIVLSSLENSEILITQDKDKGIVNGSGYVHRQEFGIDKGMWFSPKNDKLLYYRKDETMVADYSLVNWNSRVASNNPLKYPMAGEKSEEVTLVVYDIATKKNITLQTAEPKEQYLTSVTWDPSGKYIYVGVLNREQNHLKLNKYDALNGYCLATLFEEKHKKYVEPMNNLKFLSNEKQFLFFSDRTGYNQLYLYDVTGKLIKNLGFKNIAVDELNYIDPKGEYILYTGITNNGLDRQLFKTFIKTAKTEQLTTSAGTHKVSVSKDGKYYTDSFTNLNTPNIFSVVDTKSKKSIEILKAANPLDNKVSQPKIELVTITSADGKTPLNGRIIYPLNFDETKKYPVMLYVYGGPHAQLITNAWLGKAAYFDLYMAQNDYIVFSLDNRGSAARGKEFEQGNHRQLGVNEMADQIKGIEFLKTKSFVNANKIGVYGWSFGGFMSISLMLNYPDIFKVGVSGGPVTDWKYYEVMYGERYMDTPQENPEGYKNTSVIENAGKLKGRLLVIHGAQDPVVVQQHSMNFIEACIKAGKPVDYFLYPNHEHNVRGKDRIHLHQKIAQYFDDFLK